MAALHSPRRGSLGTPPELGDYFTLLTQALASRRTFETIAAWRQKAVQP